MLVEYTARNEEDIHAGDLIEIGKERLTIKDFGKIGLYVSSSICALSASAVLQLHLFGCKLLREQEESPPERGCLKIKEERDGLYEIHMGDELVCTLTLRICAYCAKPIPNCADTCVKCSNCWSAWCSAECADKDLLRAGCAGQWDRAGNQVICTACDPCTGGEYSFTTCGYCREDLATETALLEFALAKLGTTRSELAVARKAQILKMTRG